jgi:two-component system sensor histidine kinase MtrB
MRTRLIVAFVVVGLLSAIALAWFTSLILPWYHVPSWLSELINGPRPLARLLYTKHRTRGRPWMDFPPPAAALAYCLIAVVVLLALAVGVAYAASRRVLSPVRRLAQAAHRMSDGDLTVRIPAQGRDELARLVTSFNEMASALENKVGELQRMEARARQFAGDVSHELRTPLTAMTAVTDILHGHPGLTGDAAAAGRLIRQEVLHLNRLVEDLIEISRFDAGTAQLVTDVTDVATAVGRCLSTRNWTGVVITDVPAGLTVRLDRRRFDVIVANLVGNALRHGSLPVSVTVGVHADGDGAGQLIVAVRDHGRGLPAEVIPHVFDRFYKADTARSRSEGSGLGLAIAWENALLHGGRIDVGNHPGGGAVFTLRVPLDPAPLPAREVSPAGELARL